MNASKTLLIVAVLSCLGAFSASVLTLRSVQQIKAAVPQVPTGCVIGYTPLPGSKTPLLVPVAVCQSAGKEI